MSTHYFVSQGGIYQPITIEPVPDRTTAATLADIQDAIDRLDADAIGAEPTGSVEAAIANLNLTPAGIGAEPTGSVEAAISKIKPYRKLVRTQWGATRNLLLRQWSDHANWEPSGHLVEILSYFYEISQIDYSSRLCIYSRGDVKVMTKVAGRYTPEWSEPTAVDGVLWAGRQLYRRDLSLVIPQWQRLLISITTPLSISENINANAPGVVYFYKQ